MNSVFLWVKYFIFSNRYKNTLPNITALKNFVSMNARDLHNVLLFKGKSSDFSMIWAPNEYETLEKGYRPLTAAALSTLPRLTEMPLFNLDYARMDSIDPD